MDSIKYVGLDVHRDTISVAVLNAEGKLVMQSVIATHAAAILDFLHGSARDVARDLRRRHALGLAVRFAGATSGAAGGVQSAQECAVEGGQQERHDRCAQAGRVAACRAISRRCITARTARRR